MYQEILNNVRNVSNIQRYLAVGLLHYREDNAIL
jgi:hypothetical protein